MMLWNPVSSAPPLAMNSDSGQPLDCFGCDKSGPLRRELYTSRTRLVAELLVCNIVERKKANICMPGRSSHSLVTKAS